MTPKEKARELVEKMLLDHDMPYDLAQECALIAVDLLLSEFGVYEFYTEVKQEIEKL